VTLSGNTRVLTDVTKLLCELSFVLDGMSAATASGLPLDDSSPSGAPVWMLEYTVVAHKGRHCRGALFKGGGWHQALWGECKLHVSTSATTRVALPTGNDMLY